MDDRHDVTELASSVSIDFQRVLLNSSSLTLKSDAARTSMCSSGVKTKTSAKGEVGDVVDRIPQWQDFDEKPEVQTLRVQFLRRAILFTIYFAWVCVLVSLLGMWAITGVTFVCALVLRDFTVVPDVVRWFLIAMMLWASYCLAAPGDHTWQFLCRLYRDTLTKYPYFRYNRCVFEDDEEETNGAAPAASTSAQQPLIAADARAIFSFHPHGILTCGFSVNGVHHTRFAQSNIRWLVAENMFWFPVLRELLSWLGCDNVTKESFTKLMRAGSNIGFLLGGFEEATLYQRGKYRVFLKKRFGFIKLALQHGTATRLQIFGHAVQFPTITSPTTEDVRKYQQIYIEALRGVFDRNKIKFAVNPNAVLEIL